MDSRRAYNLPALPQKGNPRIILDRIVSDPFNMDMNYFSWLSLEHRAVSERREAAGMPDFAEDFCRNWRSYLVAEAETRYLNGRFSLEDAASLIGTAYNVASAIESILWINPSGNVPQVAPFSRIKEDIGFGRSQMRMLHGTLNHIPSERNPGLIKSLGITLFGIGHNGFYEQQTVADIVNYVFNDMKNSGKETLAA